MFTDKGMANCADDKEEEGPEEASLHDLLQMVEQLIAQKGMAKKKPAAEVSVTMIGKPKPGEEGQDGEELPMAAQAEEDDEEEMKRKLLG